MQFAWLPCSLILRQEQVSEKETAEVNTRKPCGMLWQKYKPSKDLARGYCLILRNTYLLKSSLNRVRTQGYGYYSLLWPDQLYLLMPCVTINARMANSTVSCLYAAVPIIFHDSPLVAIILAGLLTTLFLYLSQSV